MTLDEIRAQHPEYGDLSDEDLADGLYRKFYSDMPREEFEAKIGAAPPVSDKGSFIDPIMQGLTFGFGDEIAGGVGGVMNMLKGKDFSEGYSKTRDVAREDLSGFQERNPIGSTALEIAGALPTAVIPLGAAARGAGLTAKVGRGALAGGVSGAAYGTGAADGDMSDRVRGAATGAVTGGLVGGAVPLVGRAIGKTIGAKAGTKAAPTMEHLKTATNNFYKASEQQGLVINPNSFANMASDLIADLNAAGIDKGIQPKAYAAAQRVVDAAKTGAAPTLKDIDLLRQLSVGIARDGLAGKNEQRIAGKIIERLDDFVDNLKPSDVQAGGSVRVNFEKLPNGAVKPSGVTVGDPLKAVSYLNQARALYKSKAKAELINQAMENASNSASGVENGLRNEFRKLANSKRLAKYWTKDERAAIERVIRGNVRSNMLRFFGTFGIPLDQGRNWLGAFLGGGGVAALNPAAGIAAVVGGTAAKAGASKMTQGFAKQAGAVARSGGKAPFNQAAARLAEERANRFLQAGGRAVVPQMRSR